MASISSRWRFRSALLLFALGCSAGPVAIRPGPDPSRPAATTSVPLPEGPVDPAVGERWLAITLVDGPPVLADYRVENGILYCTPRHPLVPGRLYHAADRDGNRTEIRLPERPPGKAARVDAIYPGAERLPANLLKFYIHFSKPMREGEEVFDQIRLLDDQGRPVYDPWRRVDLWTADATRLTLWIHPGRIKRGVGLREKFGPVLEPGRSYTLEIGAGVLDAEGLPLGQAVTKRFVAGEDDRVRPSIESWTLEAPRAGGRSPLVVRFPEPMDRWLAPKYIVVEGVAGRAEMGPEERSWAFTPDRPWEAGTVTLRADAFLEDLAGNTPDRLFESDLTEAPPPPARRTREVRIP
jgi:hypothetical protein